MLLSTGSEAHSYEPTPLDILKIQECDIFIYIGGEDEVWVDKILDSIDTEDKTIVKLIDTVELLEEEAIEVQKDTSIFIPKKMKIVMNVKKSIIMSMTDMNMDMTSIYGQLRTMQ